MINMNNIIGSHNLLFITLDTLRYDVAMEAQTRGLTPNITKFLPAGTWEKRHTTGSFTYSAHHAFFSGFLPVPTDPGTHKRLMAAAFPGSETVSEETFLFEEANIIEALRSRGYHTVCIGGVGFFNKLTAVGKTLPSLFCESHWDTTLGVTDNRSTENQVNLAMDIIENAPANKNLFLFINISALHQPNCIFTEGAAEDTAATQVNALAYVDKHLGTLLNSMTMGTPTFCIICSDHGTAYGEDGYHGHRNGHPVIWTVPYGEFIIDKGNQR